MISDSGSFKAVRKCMNQQLMVQCHAARDIESKGCFANLVTCTLFTIAISTSGSSRRARLSTAGGARVRTLGTAGRVIAHMKFDEWIRSMGRSRSMDIEYKDVTSIGIGHEQSVLQ